MVSLPFSILLGKTGGTYAMLVAISCKIRSQMLVTGLVGSQTHFLGLSLTIHFREKLHTLLPTSREKTNEALAHVHTIHFI